MELWQSVGGQVMSLSPEEHDQLVSRSSHLPHVVAAELVNYVLCSSHPPEQARLCAGGFRDTTRIASGSPEMWRDIALANHDNLQAALDFFIQDLQQFQSHLKQRNSAAIEQFFASAKAKRDGWRKAAETPPPTTPE
jgi:prephenate dehydrogenase